MNKAEFLDDLNAALDGLPLDEARKTVEYYSEIIDDRIEDGLTEEEAVAQTDDIALIRERLIDVLPLQTIVRSSVKNRTKPSALTIVLLVLGAPMWIPLLLTAGVIVLTVLLVLWTVVAVLWVVVGCLWVTMAALGLSAVAALVLSVIRVCTGRAFIEALLMLGGALVCAGVGIIMYFLSLLATKGMAKLTALTAKGQVRLIKRIFTGKAK